MDALLDSTFLISAERRGRAVWNALVELEPYVGNGKIGISVLSIMELAHGIVRADSSTRAKAREDFLLEVAKNIVQHPITSTIALRAGKLDGLLTSQGSRIATADLLIAATALELNYTVITSNVRHFERIPDLRWMKL